jgi:membrane protein YqaA with SNARE-associated domain
MIVYITLFVVSFASATLLPMGSEALLLYDISLGYSLVWIWLVATLGNTLGSVVNYILGYKGEEYLESKDYLQKETISKYKHYFQRYGGWLILLAWMPIIGDPITFIAGVLKYRFRYFVLLVTISKGMRYLIWILV